MNRHLFLTFFIAALLTLSASSAMANNSICIVSDPTVSDQFGGYLAEIVKTEGFRNLSSKSLSDLTPSQLQPYGTVIISDVSLTTAQADMFRSYVSNGGNLIGMRPDSKLNDVFGISEIVTTVGEGFYSNLDSSLAVTSGLHTTTPLKIHGNTHVMRAAQDATKVASLLNYQEVDAGYASTVMASYGSGQTAAFSYDLARSTAYLRQGNPSWAGMNHDERATGISPSDLFYNGTVYWNDQVQKDGILQADEQMRLLTHIIENMNASQTPMPRLWYFPDAKKSALVFTGDQDFSKISDINNELNTVEAHGAKASIYLLGPENPSTTQVDAWLANGHDIGVHVDARAIEQNPTWAQMSSIVSTQLNNFKSNYPNAPNPKTVRNHYTVWCGKDASGAKEFAAQALIEENHGLEIDFSYYFNGYMPSQGTQGYSIPSALPMRFATSKGNVIDVFQADTQLPDAWAEDAPQAYLNLLNASLSEGKYAWIVANYHPVIWENNADEAQSVLETAVNNEIPIMSGEQMNSFLRKRDNTDFQDIVWENGELTFSAVVPAGGYGNLTLMLPKTFDGDPLAKLYVNDQETSFNVQTIAGSTYVLFTIGNGSNLISAQYMSLPGDANHDFKVDAEDAAVLAANWLCDDATWSMGDFDGNGYVDERDATLLAANWGTGVAQAAVPEPCIGAFLVGAIHMLTFTRRQMRK